MNNSQKKKKKKKEDVENENDNNNQLTLLRLVMTNDHNNDVSFAHLEFPFSIVPTNHNLCGIIGCLGSPSWAVAPRGLLTYDLVYGDNVLLN